MRKCLTLSLVLGLTLTSMTAFAQDKKAKKKVKNTSGVPIPAQPEFPKSPPEARGLAIAKYAEKYDSQWKDQYSIGKLTLYDAKGDAVVRSILQMFLEDDKGDKSIIRFRSPVEIKGVAALTHEHSDAPDDSWLYLPSSKRTRRISGANKTASFQGTEFTYEDLASRAVVKYEWKFLGEEDVVRGKYRAPCYKVEAKPNYKNTAYSRLVLYFQKTRWRVEKMELYDKAGRLLKIMTNGGWKRVHGRFWRATQVEMKNVQTKKRTVIKLKTLLVNLSLYKDKKGNPRKNLTEKNFTTRSLEGR